MNVRNFTGAWVAIAALAALAITACTSTSDGLELKLDDERKDAVATQHQDRDEGAYSTEQLIHLHIEN